MAVNVYTYKTFYYTRKYLERLFSYFLRSRKGNFRYSQNRKMCI
jgi:hypothetical protein